MVPSETAEAASECVEKLKVLAETTRLAIMELLMDGPKHAGELNDALRIEQSLCSHHLQVLRKAGFVQAVRDGKAVLYSVAPGIKITGPREGIDLGCCRLSFARK